jgi:hypothetical protein
MANWKGGQKEPVVEKSQKQVEYESALSYINSKGFDVETSLKKAKPKDNVEITIMKDGKKFIDSQGRDRVKIVPIDTDLLKKVAETVINLYIYLKSKEK